MPRSSSAVISPALWNCTLDVHGANGPTRIVRAPRDVARPYSYDIYAGQLCVLGDVGFHERPHAVRYRGEIIVASVQFGLPEIRLYWGTGSPEYIDVDRDEIEDIGAVLGVTGKDANPLLWMFGN